MNFEESLQSYMDGTLGDAEQTEMFHIMAVSPEKRAAYNQYVALRAAMQTDRVAEVVPLQFEESILAASMVRVPVEPFIVNAGTGYLAATLRAMVPYAVALGLVATGVTGYFIGKNSGTSNGSQAVVQNSTSVIAAPSQQTATLNSQTGTLQDVPSTVDAKSAHHKSAVTVALREQSANLASTNDVTTSHNNIAAQPAVTKLAFAGETPRTYPVANTVQVQDDNRFPIACLPTSLYSDAEGDDQLHVQAEAQFGGAALMPSIATASLNAAPVTNMWTARIGVKAAENTTLGLAAGQSTFALKYTSQPSPLKTITFLQYSSTAFGAAYVRQQIPSLEFFNMEPGALLEVGASQLGPMVSAQLGVSYPLARFIHADISGVFSDLFFQHEAKWFSSQKLGIVMGIRTEF